jgi:hypothetical protein
MPTALIGWGLLGYLAGPVLYLYSLARTRTPRWPGRRRTAWR